jgi:hypothetical protein
MSGDDKNAISDRARYALMREYFKDLALASVAAGIIPPLLASTFTLSAANIWCIVASVLFCVTSSWFAPLGDL